MPVQEFDGNDSWGYNPCFFFAMDKAYGTKAMYITWAAFSNLRSLPKKRLLVLSQCKRRRAAAHDYKTPGAVDRLIEWEQEDNIFHRRLTRTETPSEVKARLLSKSQTGFSSPRSK